MKKMAIFMMLLVGFFAVSGCDSAETVNVKLFVDSCSNGKGEVYGSGSYIEGTRILLVAVPNEGYVFEKWDDGDTNAVRYIDATDDADYVAYFVEEKNILL